MNPAYAKIIDAEINSIVEDMYAFVEANPNWADEGWEPVGYHAPRCNGVDHLACLSATGYDTSDMEREDV